MVHIFHLVFHDLWLLLEESYIAIGLYYIFLLTKCIINDEYLFWTQSMTQINYMLSGHWITNAFYIEQLFFSYYLHLKAISWPYVLPYIVHMTGINEKNKANLNIT